MKPQGYFFIVWEQFKKHRIGLVALIIFSLFFLIGLYAPLLASSKPLVVYWNGKLFFPLFRYLFYKGFYTKPIDLFFNLLMFTLPLVLLTLSFFRGKLRKLLLLVLAAAQVGVFTWVMQGGVKDPATNSSLLLAKQESHSLKKSYREDPLLIPFAAQESWKDELGYLTPYAKLNQLLRYQNIHSHHNRLLSYLEPVEQATGRPLPTLWRVWERNEKEKMKQLSNFTAEKNADYLNALDQLPGLTEAYRPFSHGFIMAKYELEHAQNEKQIQDAQQLFEKAVQEAGESRFALVDARRVIEDYLKAQADLNYLVERRSWLEKESEHLRLLVYPLLRHFHWEEDAGGAQVINKHIPWWELTRVNRKDLVASLLFGIRISIVVGVTAVALSLLIGIPLGLLSGYFVGRTDLLICRIVEVWEAMPTFFMLLLVVAITQSKSIFLVVAVLGMFGWTSMTRFLRSEVLKQRNLPYVLSSKTMGYTHKRIMFSHILPNAIPPILTLLPFSMMAAITSEAGLSFLGLGEEGSTSWGVLMDEGRSVFPSESYLLWPPAILLTILLISIALLGDALRDAIDPKMRT